MEKPEAGCIIGPAVKPPASGNMSSLPQMILERRDLAIVVTGALSCVRGIYKTVAALGKLHQFHYCVLEETDYADKRWPEKYAAVINRVLQRKGLGGIIVYAGCLDMLAAVNFNQVRPLLSNPAHIPVEILFRGPVAAAARKPKEALTELLNKIPPTDGVLEEDGFVLPPPLPDFVGVAATLTKRSSCDVVLDIGGCSACISPAAVRNDFSRLKKTIFANYAELKKYQDTLPAALLGELKAQGRDCCVLLETPVVKKAGLDMPWLKDELQAQGITTVSFHTSGYRTSVEGIASALLQLGEQAKRLSQGKKPATCPNLIGVLGADSGQSAFQEKIHHGIEHFMKDGYAAIFPEDIPWQEMDKLATVRLNWVVSAVAVPLAEYLQKEFGIPYFCAIPIGARAMFLWRNQVNRLMQNTKAEVLPVPPPAAPAPVQKKVLAVGDPILTAGIKRYFIAMEGYQQVDRAVYTPVPGLAAFTAEVTANASARGLEDEALSVKDAPLCLKDTADWQRLAAQYDIIVCDSLLQLCLGSKVQPERWINIPDGIFSSGLVAAEDYTIFGKKGAAWLKNGQVAVDM